MRACLFTLLLFASSYSAQQATPESADLAIVGGKIIPAYGEQAIEDGVVIVRGGRIACVGSWPDCIAPAGTRTIDAAGAIVAPGLIDAHVHYAQTGWFDGSPAGFNVSEIYDKAALDRRTMAGRHETDASYVCAGVTAVFDMGGPHWTLSHAGESAVLRAAAGPILTDMPDTVLKAFNSDQAISLYSARTPEAMRRQTLALAEAGADVIKVILSPSDLGDPEPYAALLSAAIAAAGDANVQVSLHALARRDAATGVRLGVDILAHSVMDKPLGADLAATIADRGIIYIPTFIVRRRFADGYAIVLGGAERDAPDPLGCLDGRTDRLIEADADRLADAAPDFMRADGFVRMQMVRTQREEAVMAASLRDAFDAGVTVAMGSDAGNPNTPHGVGLLYELEALEAVGFEPEVLLKAATLGGAAALGLENELGRLAPDAHADIVIYKRDPRESTAHLWSVRNVVLGGRLR